MKRKITVDCGNVGYWEVQDIAAYYKDMKEKEGEERANEYFKAGVFDGCQLDQYNGKHFIYEFMESLLRRDHSPSFLGEEGLMIKQIVVEEVIEKPKLVKCERCVHCRANLKEFPNLSYVCRKGKHDLKEVKNIKEFEVECDAFESKYIEYPLTIQGIEPPKEKGLINYSDSGTGALVKIRPCKEEYGNKTYLGILLGEADIGLRVGYNKKTQKLAIVRQYNPAIWVPELKKVIYGYESWWGIIESEEELREITDEEINNVWYVKILKEIEKTKKDEG